MQLPPPPPPHDSRATVDEVIPVVQAYLSGSDSTLTAVLTGLLERGYDPCMGDALRQAGYDGREFKSNVRDKRALLASLLRLREAPVDPRTPPSRGGVNVELMNTLPGSQHHLDFLCKCGAVLCVAADVGRINLNCVWIRVVANTRSGKKSWNPYKAEFCLQLHCAVCGHVVGASYPEKRLHKLFYVSIKGEPRLYCRPTSAFTTVEEAVALHQPLDPNDRRPWPRHRGALVKRDLERQQARERGLPEDDDRVLRALSAQLRDATLRDAIGAKQQAVKAREEAQRLQEENRKLEEKAERLTCSVCMERQIDELLTPCRHVFCSKCVAQLSAHKSPCPICRAVFDGHVPFYL